MTLRTWVTAGSLLALALATEVRAGDCYAPCPPKVVWVDKAVTCYRPEWRERDVTCTVNRMVTREVVVPMRCVTLVPEWREVQRTIYVPRMVAREVERDVTCCRPVQTTVTDSCTGCTYTVCKPELYVQRVRYTVMECVPEQKAITVKVCSLKPVERTVECRRLVCELKPETVTRTERFCVLVPYQATVKVPVCAP